MKTNFEACLAHTLQYEGGHSDDPYDPGGRTNKGITQRTYDAFRKMNGLRRRDVYKMLDAEMHEIYRVEYWDAVKADELPSGADMVVFDAAVNSGVEQALKWMAACGVAPADTKRFVSCYSFKRLSFLEHLHTWLRFGSGWARRVYAVKFYALTMVNQ